MTDLDELKQHIEKAKECLDYMLEDVTGDHSDAAQAFMESAEEAQRQIIKAEKIVFLASQHRQDV